MVAGDVVNLRTIVIAQDRVLVVDNRAFFIIGCPLRAGEIVGIAGLIGFWMMAGSLVKLAKTPGSKVQSAVLAWSLYRFGLYGAVLFKAYTLDRETYHGMLAAVAGILIVRFVLMFLGFTGIDLGAPKPADQEDEQR